uniref:Chondroitin proteoglycan 3 n=1 Tax=Haemonchus contortus TaxID=6289 RepID=A0A7I4YWN2_HAECO
MYSVLLLILTLTSTFCFPMLEDDDAVLVASGELTDKEVAALDLKTLSNSATVVYLNGDTVEGSGEEIPEVDEQAESTLGKPQASEEFRALESKCEEWELCYRDSDCHGGKCLGIFVGTCNCNACLDLWLCESDAACGGLKGACNQTTRTCDCLAGFKKAGFPFYVDALHGLCNQRTCTDKDHDEKCFGLPCHFGKCQC